MQAVLRTVYDCLPPPTFAGSDLPCGGGGEFVLSKLPVAVQWDIIGRLTSKDSVRLSVLSRYWYNFISSSAMVRVSQHFSMSSVEREDRISFLPSCLRSNIISRLPIRDAFRTKILSRRWCHDWASTPLNLDDSHLLRMNEKDRIQRLSRILMEHPGPFNSVHLIFTSFNHRRDALLLWLSLLSKKHVKELVLVNRSLPVDLLLPIERLMLCTSLQHLALGFFRIPSLTGHQGQFQELRKLGLYCTQIDSADLSRIFLLSPVLESCCMVASYGFPDSICVQGHQKLRSVVLWLCIASELSISDCDALNRIILCNTHTASPMCVKIGHVQKLQSLGYLEPGVQNLVINDTMIQAGTKANPDIVVPSVEVLGCRLSFGDKKQSNMLLAFLRCFPHVETLHIQANEPAGKFNLTTWLNKADGIDCVDENIKKLFFHQFHGERSELAFLKFIWMKAKSLEQMVIILSAECLERVAEIQSKLIELGSSVRASKKPSLLVIDTDIDIPIMFDMASDASVRDPFFCMDGFEPSIKDQDQAAIMVKDVKPAVELNSRHYHEQVGMTVNGVASTVELSSGHMMPMLGLTMGPWLPMDKPKICALIKYALDIGYRHFDLTGDLQMAANIADALAEACELGIVKREDLFISLKVCSDKFGNMIVPYSGIRLKYIDLGLVDYPLTSGRPGRRGVFSWHNLEEAVSLGNIRSIGLRKFGIAQIEDCLLLCNKIIPTVNLVPLVRFMEHDALVNFCRKYGIYIMAQYPIPMHVPWIDDPIIKSLALKYSKTPKQIILRWFLQSGTGVFQVVSFSSRGNSSENLKDSFENPSDLFDFKICDDDMEAIKLFNRA